MKNGCKTWKAVQLKIIVFMNCKFKCKYYFIQKSLKYVKIGGQLLISISVKAMTPQIAEKKTIDACWSHEQWIRCKMLDNRLCNFKQFYFLSSIKMSVENYILEMDMHLLFLQIVFMNFILEWHS